VQHYKEYEYQVKDNEKHMNMLAQEIERLKALLHDKLKENDVLKQQNYELKQ
jgi:hypothetical protein